MGVVLLFLICLVRGIIIIAAGWAIKLIIPKTAPQIARKWWLWAGVVGVGWAGAIAFGAGDFSAVLAHFAGDLVAMGFGVILAFALKNMAIGFAKRCCFKRWFESRSGDGVSTK